jgi:HD superfamily phosphodiesterase
MAAITRLKSLAGVRIPDSPLAKAAVDLLEVTSPQFICNHCVRTYVFENLAVRRIGRSIIDEEIAFCGALLHDLGLVPAHAGESRFEVDGASGCTLHGQPIPTASQLMLAAPFAE